jgi:hypothetical protein
VASHNHRLKPPRMFRPADAPKLVVGPTSAMAEEEGTGRTEGTPCGAAGSNTALARQQQPRLTPLAAVMLARSDPTATRQ